MKFVSLFFIAFLSMPILAKDYAVGQITSGQIMSDFPKFQKHKNDVDYDAAQLAPLKSLDDEIQIKIFFGQWCHDSQREVPRLIQLFNKLDKPNFEVTYYALDTKKSDPLGLAKQYEIKRTPTIIVLKNGQELARVLEFPSRDWPSDLSTILVP